MTRLLELLERQVELLEAGREADCKLLAEIADFFRSFPDLYHHPKEELIVRQLSARDPASAEPLAGLFDEHEEGSQELQRFSRALVHMRMEPEARRAAFIEAARVFLDNERRHMAWEEGHFFDVVEAHMTKADWAAVDEKIARLGDPLAERNAYLRSSHLELVLSRWRAPPPGCI